MEDIFVAIIWSIWLVRNELILRNKSCSPEEGIDLIKIHLASWCKGKWPKVCFGVSNFLNQPNFFVVPQKPVATRMDVQWCFPNLFIVKFNVGGFSLSKPGPTGIGGPHILRNHRGVVLAKFSKSVGSVDSN